MDMHVGTWAHGDMGTWTWAHGHGHMDVGAHGRGHMDMDMGTWACTVETGMLSGSGRRVHLIGLGGQQKREARG